MCNGDSQYHFGGLTYSTAGRSTEFAENKLLIDIPYTRLKLNKIRNRLKGLTNNYTVKLIELDITDLERHLDDIEGKQQPHGSRLHCQDCEVEFLADKTWHFIGGKEFCEICYNDNMLWERTKNG